MNPDLDQTTRSVQLQATFENADKRLQPGMFVRVEVVFPEEQTVLADAVDGDFERAVWRFGLCD